MTSIPQSSSASKPIRSPLPRSPSAPNRLSTPAASPPKQQQQIYVLSADGSRLFLLDPTKPANEEPPPYAPFQPSPERHAATRSLSSANLRLEAGPSSTHINALISPQRNGHLDLPSEDPLTRHRARTLSALNPSASSRPRYRTFTSHTPPRTRSAASSPNFPNRVRILDETTPLFAAEEQEEVLPQRGSWRSIFCGDLDRDEEEKTWSRAWRRYWRPWQRKEYWRATLHLVLLNFPFALLIWPWLVIGTLVGTALLITLPIGAAIWWITLFLSRSSARLETIMQLRYHSPLGPAISEPIYHPIFYRVKERLPGYPISPMSEFPPDIEWETRFVKCSYAMFADHYSYSALSYFLLIKPLITLFSTILIVAFFPVCLVLIFPMPIYLRVLRRWGRWQAGIAMGNL